MGRAGQGLILKKLKGNQTFMRDAACNDGDPADFMEEPRTRLRRLDNPRFITALGFCAACPVRDQCLQWAIDNHETGIWGGRYLISGHHHPLR